MPEKPKGIELPKEKRYRYFPILEENEIAELPQSIRQQIEKFGLTEEAARAFAIQEFVKTTGADKNEIRENHDLRKAADIYFETLKERRSLKERLAALEAAELSEKETGISGLGRMFESPFAAVSGRKTEKDEILEELSEIEKVFTAIRDRVRRYYKLYRESDVRKLAESGGLSEAGRAQILARETLFALMKRGDALRKERVWQREDAAMRRFGESIEIFKEIVSLRQKAEDLLRADEMERARRAGEEASKISSGMEPAEVISRFLAPEFGYLADRVMDSNLRAKPAEMTEDQFRNNISNFLMTSELVKSAETLRDELGEKEDELGRRKAEWREALRNPRNSDLAELIADKETKVLLGAYHTEKRRFLPVRELKEFIDSLDNIVSSPHGQILRAMLYGPPGTGKTEALREIGRRHGQRVRVISLHETSSFETLVGMNQIPLPRSEQLADAERFWEKIAKLSSAEAMKEIPELVLAEFEGDTEEKKTEDFKKWFETQLKAARAISALGAVSPDDPRVRKARQEALAAWLDQPLAEGLMEGDLVVLDEADRAGNALEGLQDLLTRRPGELYQPSGRPEPFRIHPDARVVMTANWGDVQTEFTAGGGKLAAPIVSRVVEKRKVDYLAPETELALLEVMTSDPDTGQSFLQKPEHDAAQVLLEKVFPKLRDFYLRPGQLQFITPISVRTLENIARRLIDESTRTRVRDEQGKPAHFVAAAWQEVASGPWRADQRDTIIRELAQTFADQGLFEFLGDSADAPLSLRVERLTGIPRTELAAFVSGHFPAYTDMKLADDFSFGAALDGTYDAANLFLRESPRYRSFKAVKTEEDRAWRRMIEDFGGTPEVQHEIEKLNEEWVRWHNENDSDFKDDPERLFAAEVKFLEQKTKGLKARVGDVRAWVARHDDMYREVSAKLWIRTGLLFSVLLNRAIERLSAEEQAALDLRFEAFPQLDYVGYKLSAGNLTIAGAVGDYAGRELNGGNLNLFRALDKLGYRMNDGKIETERAGHRAGQQMNGGEIEISEQAGNRLGAEARAGRISAQIAGERAGYRASAFISVHQAGKASGQELKEGGVLEIKSSCVSLGSGIKGDVILQGKKSIDKGRRIA